MSALRFAVCTFDRVFDTAPKQETVTLQQLVSALLRFDLKPDLERSVHRLMGKIDCAWEAWEEGGYRPGKQFTALKKAADGAKREGKDVDEAVCTALDRLRTNARGMPKRDLRLWSPTLYKPNAKRGGDDIVHLSCLVLDYDKGLAFEEAQAPWLDYFHLAHSTWSHTYEKPKFRIVLPLAGPVRPQEWPTVWNWAFGITGDWIDHAMKGVGVTFALPSSPSVEAPKIAVLHDDAPLLDPLAEGLVSDYAPPPSVVAEIDRPASHFNGGIDGHTYQELGPAEFLDEPQVTLDISGEFELPQRDAIAQDGGRAAVAPVLSPSEPADEDPGWDERSDGWETLFDDI